MRSVANARTRNGRLAYLGWVGLMTCFLSPLNAVETPTPMPGASSTAGAYPSPAVPKVILAAGSGLTFFSGNYAKLYNSGRTGYSITAGVLGQVTDNPLYVGLDFAINFWGFAVPASQPVVPGVESDLSAIGIQFLPTVLYRFTLPENPKLSPYFGFSVGPHLYVFRTRTVNSRSGVVDSPTKSSVLFQLMARPGLSYTLTEGIVLQGEPKFGVLDWDFVFQPQVSIAVAL